MFRITARAQWCPLLLLVTYLSAPFVLAESPASHIVEPARPSYNYPIAAPVNGKPACETAIPVTSEALVHLALTCNSRQAAISSRWQAQKHQIEIAGSLDDPKLMVGAAPQTFGDDRFDDGYIVELSQSLPWPGTLSLREQAASAQAAAWQARYSQNLVSLARDVRLRFSQWQYHRQLLRINQQHQQLWRSFLNITRTKYATGTTAKSAVLQATHEHHQLLQEAIELNAKIERDASQLRRLVNLPSQSLLDTNKVLESPSESLPGDAVTKLLARLDKQPAIQGLEAQRREKAHQLALAEKDRYPTISLMTRYNSLWMNEEQRWFVGAGINLPIDFGKRTSREHSLQAEQSALAWEQQDLKVQLREQLLQAYSFWQQAKAVHQLYQNDLLPLAEENLITARDEYQSGAGDFLSLLSAQRQQLTTQRKAQMTVREQFAQFANLTAAAGLVQMSEWNNLGDSYE